VRKNVEISAQNEKVENFLQTARIPYTVQGLPIELFTDKIYPAVFVQFDVKNDKYGVLFTQNVYLYKNILKHYSFQYEEVIAEGETQKAWSRSFAQPRECQSMMCLLQHEMRMPSMSIIIDEDNGTPKQLYQMWRTCYQMGLSNANVEVPVDSVSEAIYRKTDQKVTKNMSAWMTAKAVVNLEGDVTCSGEDFGQKSVGVHTEEYILFKIFLAFLPRAEM
jgi:hypothetical protein